jgi:metallo-beta-lactamase class B
MPASVIVPALAPAVVLLTTLLAAPVAPALSEDPFPPHRIADNLYYVGSKGLASFLVTTSKGHILINPSFESTVPLIRRNVEQLGFKFTDIKILLNSHAHDDHVGGMALARQLTGADVYVMRGDEKDVERGGSAGQAKHPWKPAPVKRVLEDGDTVRLGEVTLTARRTPGHTPGCTTWTMKARLGGASRDAADVVIVGSPNVNPNYRLVAPAKTAPSDVFYYPEIASDYEKSFRLWKSLPCQIFLGAHGNYYGLEAKYQRWAAGDTRAFIDPAGYQAYIAEREQAFRQKLAEQRAEAGRASPPPQN